MTLQSTPVPGTNARKGRQFIPYANQITSYSIQMAAQSITNWKQAIDSARSVLVPRRIELYKLYDIIKLDGHLESVMDKREMGITNKKVLFSPTGDTAGIDELVRDKILESPWFFDFQKYSAQAVPFGHSLIELEPDFKNGEIIAQTVLINRPNVRPEYNFVCKTPYDLENGIYYADMFRDGVQHFADPIQSPYLVSVGGRKEYGKLMTAAQYVIYKRGGFGDWAQFAELFGMPFRVGKYNAYNDDQRKKLEQGLSNMGGAGYAVIPEGASLEFHDNNHTGSSDIYKYLIEACNAEMSKIFLGQTMTTENGSSHSQSKVHKDVEEEINLNDMIRQEYILNSQFKKKMIAISGFTALEKGRFHFEKTIQIPLEKRILIDMQLAQVIPMSEEYFYDTYGVDVIAPGQIPIIVPQTTPPADEVPGNGTPTDKADIKKKRLNTRGVKLYAQNNNCCSIDYTKLSASYSEDDLSPEELELLNAIYNNEDVSYSSPIFQKNVNRLRTGLMNGLGNNAAIYASADNIAATMMEININRFGFNKSIDMIYQLNQALDLKETFPQFKKKAAQILGDYNQSYLETEYNFAIATAQNAAAYNRQKAQAKDFPYLKYVTAGDSRVRPAHAALDGRIFDLNDKSWSGIYPPNGWNCRCEMIYVNDATVTPTSGEEAKQLLGDEWDKMQKAGFAVNRGEINEVFDLNKTYLKQLPGSPDINQVGYKDAKLSKWTDMTGLKSMPVNNDVTKKTLLDEFDKNKTLVKVGNDSRAVNLFQDYANRKIAITRKNLANHIGSAYEAEKRSAFYHNISDVLANPDEVYFFLLADKQPTYRYLKFYEDFILVVNVGLFDDIETMELKTWYVSNSGDDVRVGALIKNKKS